MGVVAAIAAHFIAIGNFSLGWITLLFVGSATRSVPQPNLIDITYLVIVTYTSLGYGDTVPHGTMRLFVGKKS